ncbi:MAG: TolC family protein [Aquificaceae bacterium]|nr:TolC family protein [Aquificaceae bacterium]
MWLLVLLFFVVSHCFSLNLEELLRLAEENNPKVASKKHAVQSARLKLKASGQLYYPEVFSGYKFSFQSERQSFNIPPMGGLPAMQISSSKRSYQSFQAGIRQVLYDGGLRSSAVEISKSTLKLTEEELTETLLDVKLDVVKAFLSVLSTKELLEVVKKQKEAVAMDLRQREAFYREGLIAITDVLQARVRLAEVERDLRKTEGEYLVALANLSRLTGVEEERLKSIEPPKVEIKSTELSQWIKLSEEKRSVIKMLSERLRINQLQRRSELSQFYPKLFLEAVYNYSDQNPTFSPKGFFTVGAGLSLSFQSFKPYYTALALEEEEKGLKKELKDLKDGIALRIRSAYEGLRVAEDNLKVAEESLKFAEEFYRLSLEQYRNQIISGADLLQAEASLTQARKARVIAYYELLRAYFELLREVGEL